MVSFSRLFDLASKAVDKASSSSSGSASRPAAGGGRDWRDMVRSAADAVTGDRRADASPVPASAPASVPESLPPSGPPSRVPGGRSFDPHAASKRHPISTVPRMPLSTSSERAPVPRISESERLLEGGLDVRMRG